MLRYRTATTFWARRGLAPFWSSSLSEGEGNVTTPKTKNIPSTSTVHTVTGEDVRGILSLILDTVCAAGGTVVSSRSVRMGGSFSSVLVVKGANAASVDASVRALQDVDSAVSRPFVFHRTGSCTTSKAHFVGTFAKGLASKAITYLCSRHVSVEELDHRVLVDPGDPSSELLIMEGVLRVPSEVRGAELEEHMAKLGLTLRLMKN
mmetsp:Transcript_36749/g.91527  ORF Transcript_36749/g.91527 Transcript_36749/m.91527 type:complete len:206 (-) Transcript_36749:136-753(-)